VEDYKNEATSYIAYSGPFHVDEDNKTLTHSMFVSLFPDWTGQTQPRAVKIEDDVSPVGQRVAHPVVRKDGHVASDVGASRATPLGVLSGEVGDAAGGSAAVRPDRSNHWMGR
jgi:hypothetical protein